MVDGNLTPNLNDEELEQCYERMREQYRDRLKSVLSEIKTELERFSWHCSKISDLEDGEYAIAVSRDQSHLSPNGDFDDGDAEVIARVMNSEEWSDIRGGISFGIDVVSFGGDNIGSLSPFSVVEGKWLEVTDESQVELGMALLETCKPFDVVRMLQKWTKGRSAR